MAEARAGKLRPRAPSLEEAEGWIGWRVDDLNGSMVGHVERIVETESGEPAWLVITEWRLGDGRRFYVPAYDAVGGGGRVWSPHPRSIVRQSCRLAGPGTFTSQSDRILRTHYAREQAKGAA